MDQRPTISLLSRHDPDERRLRAAMEHVEAVFIRLNRVFLGQSGTPHWTWEVVDMRRRSGQRCVAACVDPHTSRDLAAGEADLALDRHLEAIGLNDLDFSIPADLGAELVEP